MKKPAIERLLSKIEICPKSGCWNWTGSIDRYGYGKIRPTDRLFAPVKAHRLSFRLHIGPIPTFKSANTGEELEKMLLHSCDNKKCINPQHLTPGTFHQNMFDRANPESEERTQPNNIMANLNKVMIIGNLTRDPELRYTPKGTAVAEVSIAVNRLWTDEVGTKREETTFVDVTLWGRSAENANTFLTKGRGVYVEGRLQLETWDDKETGKKRSKLKVVGESIQFLPSKDQAESSARARETKTQREERERQQGPAPAPADHEIPF